MKTAIQSLFGSVSVALTLTITPVFGQSTAFTYQGRLNSGTNPANGTYNFTFGLFSVASGAGQVGGTLTNSAAVNNGLFTSTLDFGANFPGADRWLEIGVRTNGAGTFTTLIPRQPLTPTPYATHANSAGTATVANGVNAAVVVNGQSLLIGSNNILTGAYANMAGGTGNTVNGNYGIVAGGFNNLALGNSATVSGGSGNTASGPYATVAGGSFNGAMGTNAFVGGGDHNTALDYDVVSGGQSNSITAAWSFIGGGLLNSAQEQGNVVGGGFLNHANGFVSTIGGGFFNIIQLNAASSFIGGGFANTAGGNYSTIGGGLFNVAAGYAATVAGGYRNSDVANSGAIGGGAQNTNTGGFATIPGGTNNLISDVGATISGGGHNSILQPAPYSSIGGGWYNIISPPGLFIPTDDPLPSTIGGGENNTVTTGQSASTIAGGSDNTILAGTLYCTIGGGTGNQVAALAEGATVPGGDFNLAAGSYSFAAGQQAQALHNGAFVWADSQNAAFASTANNQFRVRCLGGVQFTSGSGAANQTVSWTPGSAGWSFSSDRNLKDRITLVDPQVILEKVSRLPVVEWSYKGFAQRHLGSMAQDFHALFPLNDNETMLNDADLHGVALAAIQGLNEKLNEKDSQLQKQQQEVADLKQRLATLEELFSHAGSKNETHPANVNP